MAIRMNHPVRRALVSVSDKRGIVEFSRELQALGVEILSTGGTAELLAAHGIPVMEVSEFTGFPEIMDGRVKTLHPRIHGGLLGRRGQDDEVMEANRIQPIDLVVVNLYPFEETVSNPDCTIELAIENIDIGGPTMLRAAAKNHADVSVIVDVQDYGRVVSEMQGNQGVVSPDLRFDLAVKAFEHTAAYDGLIANYLGSRVDPSGPRRFPRTFTAQWSRKQVMRYGENPHQQAAFFVDPGEADPSISTADQIQGKSLSFNNIADSDAALECVRQFDQAFACVIVKHANPCGVAVAGTQEDAYQRAFSTDPESAFGGIIAFNTALDVGVAAAILDNQFVEVIVAPSVSGEAKKALQEKGNVRVLECGDWSSKESPRSEWEYRKVRGGLLVQDRDQDLYQKLEVVSRRAPDEAEMKDLIFTWKVAKYVKSNAIVYAANQRTLGIGAGQMSRVNSARIAAIKAEHSSLSLDGAVMASDAFFPFRDGLDNAAEVGVRAVIQPGGSLRDEEVIAAANEHGIAMVFTGMRHFRH